MRKIIFVALALIAAIFIFQKVGLRPSSAKPNVILITAQSLRPEHLSCYGYQHIKTSAIDALAKKGVLFNNAYCNVPDANLSFASILSGKIGSRVITRKENLISMDNLVKTLSQDLKGRGYSTAAITSTSFLSRGNIFFNKGFDIYENVLTNIKPAEFTERSRMATEKTLEALTELKKKKAPIFAWIEYSIPEFPYTAPDYFSKAPGDFIYDRQVLLLDSEIERLIKGLEKLGLTKNALIIFTATTGEGLDEHKEPIHGIFLYNSTVRIPLIIKFPSGLSNKKTEYPASLSDIFPTILDALKFNYSPGDFDGSSLIPGLERKPKEEKSIYLESLAGNADFGWSPLAGIISGNLKYIEAPKQELFNLALDTHELKNIAQEYPNEVKKMRADLLKYIEKNRPAVLSLLNKGTDPKDKVEVLKPYFILVSIRNIESKNLIKLYEELLKKDPDNKKFIYNLSGLNMDNKNFATATQYASKLTEKYPDYSEGWAMLGMVYHEQNNDEEAMKYYEKAISLIYDSPVALNNLAWIYMEKGIKLDEALKYAERANALAQNLPHFMDTLAMINFKKGNKDKAVELLKKAITIDQKLEILKTHLKQIEGAP